MEGKKEQWKEGNCTGDAEETEKNGRGGVGENVGRGQSIIQKRKVRRTPGAALNMPGWHHLLMGHRLACYLSRLSSPSLVALSLSLPPVLALISALW